MIEIKNLDYQVVKQYKTLNDINLTVNSGETVFLQGIKGSGKSALLRIIAGLEKPSSGVVLVNDLPVEKDIYKIKVSMGYIAFENVFFNNKTVKKNLEYVLNIRGYEKGKIESLVASAIKIYNLESIKDVKVKNLTKLEKLKVAFIRLWLRPLQILIIDDVLKGLTDDEKNEVVKLIKDLQNKNENLTIIWALEDTVKDFSGRVIKIKYGSIVE